MRCQHASEELDEEYVKKAIELGATSITFTDHAPFIGDPFDNRMRYNQLREYVTSLRTLRDQYKDEIHVGIGLEIEFIPSRIGYYKELRRSNAFDILILGQHFYELDFEKYSFSMSETKLNEKEFVGCGKAIIADLNTGLFDVVAHPDRIFRRRKLWTPEMEKVAKNIIKAAQNNGVFLEQNEESKRQQYYYWDEFWNLVPDEMVIKGLDAHSTSELKLL
jgi:histidinol-phosphatase (PHP family)